MLNSKDFTTALEIISKHHSTELALNTPKDNTREQLLGFYNYARTEYKDLEGYPEYK